MKTTYDAFGNIENEWHNGFARLPFGFAGGHYDADTGLTRFGARDYDPVIGRWITKDPAGLAAGTNLYNYSGGDPVDYVDTNGEYAFAVPFIVAGGATAVVLAVAGQTGALPNPGPALWNLSQALNPFSAVANADLSFAALSGVPLGAGDHISLAKSEQKRLREIAAQTGMSKDSLREALHKLKKPVGLGPADNVDIQPDGTVIDLRTGERLGNIWDENISKKPSKRCK